MNTFLDVMKGIALAAVAAMCITVAVAVEHLDRSRGDIFGKVNATLDKINRPCKGSGSNKADNCGTLALANQTMVNAGDLIKQSQYVEIRESQLVDNAVPGILARVNANLDTLNATTAAARPLLEAATARTNDLQPIETNLATLAAHVDEGSSGTFAQVNTAVASLNTTIGSANALIANPHTTDLLAHLDGISASTDLILQRGQQVEYKATQCYLYPTLKCRVNALFVPAFQVAGPLIQAFK